MSCICLDSNQKSSSSLDNPSGESRCCKITKVVLALSFFCAGVASIASGAVFSLIPVWVTGIALTITSLALTILCFCRKGEVSEPARLVQDGVITFKTDSVSPLFLNNLSRKELVEKYGQEILQFYQNQEKYAHELEQLRPYEEHVFKSLVLYWQHLPDPGLRGDERLFILTNWVHQKIGSLPKEEQLAKIEETINWLDDIRYNTADFLSFLPKYIVETKLTNSNLAKHTFPLCYLNRVLAMDFKERTALLDALFPFPYLLQVIYKELSPEQKEALLKYFHKDSPASKHTKMACINLINAKD